MATMCGSSVRPFPTMEKACSGKCRGGACASSAPRLWVLAACNGMVSLFKKVDSHLEIIPNNGGTVFPSLEALNSVIREGIEKNQFDQLMVIGSQHDVAWVHMSLPEAAAARIVAEMEYPLLPGWFPNAGELSHALQQVLS